MLKSSKQTHHFAEAFLNLKFCDMSCACKSAKLQICEGDRKLKESQDENDGIKKKSNKYDVSFNMCC